MWTPEERKLVRKITRARVVQWVCVLLVAAPLLFVVIGLLNLSGPDSGFVGVAIMFGVMIWWPLLLIPLLGIVLALQSKRSAQAGLQHLQKRDVEQTNDPNGTQAAS